MPRLLRNLTAASLATCALSIAMPSGAVAGSQTDSATLASVRQTTTLVRR